MHINKTYVCIHQQAMLTVNKHMNIFVHFQMKELSSIFDTNKSQHSNKPRKRFMTYNTRVASAISFNALIFNYMRWT